MEPGFTKADSRNLPDINHFMVVEYFSKSDFYLSAEIRAVKSQRYVSFNHDQFQQLTEYELCFNLIYFLRIMVSFQEVIILTIWHIYWYQYGVKFIIPIYGHSSFYEKLESAYVFFPQTYIL